MVFTRSFLVAAACTLPLSLVACGGSGEDGDTQPTPEGTHYGFVVSKASVPATTKAAADFGLDLGAPKSGTPDGTVDNRLGELLGTLAMMKFDIQGTIDKAINEGSIILLVDFQTQSFMSASAAGFSVKLGANPMPAACSGTGTGQTCGQHLKGTASFSLDPKSPTDALVSGKIVNGTFNGGPGDLTLQIVLGTPVPITLSLLKARAKATEISDAGMTVTVGGALTITDLNSQVIPVIKDQIAGLLDRDCGTTRALPNCGCPAGSTGETLLNLFDGSITGMAKDCNISADEIQQSPILKSLLSPDVCSTKSCPAPDAVSLGIKVTTVKATIN